MGKHSGTSMLVPVTMHCNQADEAVSWHGNSIPGDGQLLEAGRCDGLFDTCPAGVIAGVQQDASQVC